MKEQANVASSNTQKTNQLKDSGWLTYLLGPVIVGIIVLLGQAVVAPIVAKHVKTEESILEQRYKVCESAVNLLQRRLASVPITGTLVPEWYEPPEKNPPTQLEMNTTYTLLTIYCKSQTIAEEFFVASGPGKTSPLDIVKFVSAVRKELGVDKKGFTGGKFSFRFLRPVGENGQKDKEAKDEQKQ